MQYNIDYVKQFTGNQHFLYCRLNIKIIIISTILLVCFNIQHYYFL